MKILWIEDFGGVTDVYSFCINIFDDLIPNFELIENIDLRKNPEKLSVIFEEKQKYPLHQIILCRHYEDFAKLNLSEILPDIDLILLDLNLSAGHDPILQISGYIPEEGGLYLHNALIYAGFPRENIRILTGQDATLKKLKESCAKNYIPLPDNFSFEKNEGGFKDLRGWLSKKLPYITLRRGIIGACQYIKKLIDENGAEKIQFKNFLKEKPEDAELVTNMRDYLETLEKFLPIVEPTDKTRYYKLFVRTLAHEWEDNASPYNFKLDEKEIINKATKAFGWIMKSVRNWMAHNALTEEFNETFVAFLFIVAMRSMFKLQDNQLSYEKILFSLFENVVEERQMKEIIKNREIPLAETYIEVKNKLLEKDENKKDFNDIVNTLQVKRIEHNYIKSLYQIYWFVLPQFVINSDKPQKEQAKDEWTYTTTFSIKTGISYGKNQFEENPEFFLFHFSRHIYNYSF